jgi:hypothetical protein
VGFSSQSLPIMQRIYEFRLDIFFLKIDMKVFFESRLMLPLPKVYNEKVSIPISFHMLMIQTMF